jgi:hypothetical protein
LPPGRCKKPENDKTAIPSAVAAIDQGFGFQFKMTVMGDAASSVTVLMRNRWPSEEAMYQDLKNPCTAPPTCVTNSGMP